MFKIIKWILLILIGLQLINWYMLKTDIPISIVSALEKNGCIGYQSNGMDFPISYLINTETYQKLLDENADNHNPNNRCSFFEKIMKKLSIFKIALPYH